MPIRKAAMAAPSFILHGKALASDVIFRYSVKSTDQKAIAGNKNFFKKILAHC